jgi:hypothetical protein
MRLSLWGLALDISLVGAVALKNHEQAPTRRSFHRKRNTSDVIQSVRNFRVPFMAGE